MGLFLSSVYVILYCHDDKEYEKGWRIISMGELHYANRLSPCSDFFTTLKKSSAVGRQKFDPLLTSSFPRDIEV